MGTLIHICSTYWERGVGTLFSSFFLPNTFSGNNLCLTIPVVPGSGIECCELKFFSPIHRTHMKLLLIVCFIATLWLLDSFRHVLGACDGLHGIFGEFLSPKKLSCYLFCSVFIEQGHLLFGNFVSILPTFLLEAYLYFLC